MMPHPTPLNDSREQARLAEVAALHIMGPAREIAFDQAAQLVARMCRMPMAAIMIVGESVVWSKAIHGVEERLSVPRAKALCDGIVRTGKPIIIEDLVDQEVALPIRAYIGAPLRHRGQIIGSVCAMDWEPFMIYF